MKKMHKLINWVSKSDLSEFAYEDEGVKIRLRKGPKEIPHGPGPGMMPPPSPRGHGRKAFGPGAGCEIEKKPARLPKRSSKSKDR